MADKTMHHVVIGSDTYEIVDSVARVGAEAAFATDTASGSIATFPDGADGVPVKSLSVAVEAVQSGSGDPSLTNVRPISGWDSVKVFRAPINAPMSTFTGDGYESGVYLTNTGATQESVSYAITAYIPVTPGKTVIIHAGRVSNPSFGWYDANKTYISGEKYNSRVPITLTVPEGVAYIRCSWNASTNYIEADVDVYDIPLPQTVYGGTLDVSTGELVIDHALVDLGTLTWTMPDSTNHIFRTTGIVNHKRTSGANYLCSAYLPVNSSVSTTAMGDKTCKGNSTTGTYLYVRNTDYSDAATFKTSLSGVMLCYEMDELQTMTLTPEQVTTLLGQNNIYADSGSVNVTYRADTGLYINKRFNA